MAQAYRDLEPMGRAGGYTVSTGWRPSDKGPGEMLAIVLEGDGESFEVVAFQDLPNAAEAASMSARSIVYALAAIEADKGAAR